MFQNNDEDPKDWEIEEEDPPESLKRRWEKEEGPEAAKALCPACKKETPPGSLSCIYCGTVISKDFCPFSCFASWLKRLFRGRER